jgi:hypothetical protein
MTAICREELLDCLRKLEQERRRCWEEAAQRDLRRTVTHGYLGVVDGIAFAVGEIAARFGIGAEEIEEEPAAEAKPEKKMAPSKGEATRERERKTS